METPDDREFQELVQSLDPTSRVLMSEVILGQDGEEFLRSELGKTMLGMARQDYAEAVLKLAEVPWWRKGQIRSLQRQADHAKRFLDYLRELILRGRSAQAALAEGEDHG